MASGPEPCIVRWFTFEALLKDVERKRYDRLRRLCIAAGIDTASEKFLSILNEKRACGDVPLCDSIFEDMCYFIAEKIAGDGMDGSLLGLFVELFQDDRFLRSDPELMRLASESWEFFRHGTFIDAERGSVAFRDEEPVFGSRAFRSFVTARRRDMAEFLKIREEDLTPFLKEHLRPIGVVNDDGDEVEYCSPRNVYFGTAYLTLTKYLEARGGAAEWIREMLSPGSEYLKQHGIRRRGFYYEPDIDGLIEQYCRGKVHATLLMHGELTRPMLRHECVPGSPLEDIISISWLYFLDLVFEMLRRTRERYYREFSFETFSGKTSESGYLSRLEGYKKQNALQAEKIRALEEQLRAWGEKADTAILESERALRKESEALKKELAEKAEEISRLKKRLSWQEALTDEVENDSSEDAPDADVSLIKTKRYLFVGFPEAVAELRREFPTSVFMTSESKGGLSDLQVDAVVLLTRYMKHRTYYKIRSEKNLENVPLVYCNKSSTLENVYAAIWRSADKLSLR